MPLTTIAFCHHCKWRSSESALQRDAAGAPCPTCGCGISTLHCDPAYTGTDQFGRHYVEAQAIHDYLTDAGVKTGNPVGVGIPSHSELAQPPTAIA